MPPLSVEQLAKAGLRPAEPVPECKAFGSGWIAKCRFRLTDQEIVVIDYADYQFQSMTNGAGEEVSRYEYKSEPKITGNCMGNASLASYTWQRQEILYQKAEDRNDGQPITSDIQQELTNTLVGINWLDPDGIILIEGGKAPIFWLLTVTIENKYQNVNSSVFGNRIYMGDPDDLDLFLKKLEKQAEADNRNNTFRNWEYAWSTDLGEDADTCPHGWEKDGYGFFGAICKRPEISIDIQETKVAYLKVNGSPRRARRANLELGMCLNQRKNPWTVTGPRWKDVVIPCEKLPSDPDVIPVHKKGILKSRLRPTTDNIIGLPDTEEYDQEVWLPRIIKRGGVEYEVPDETVSARLHRVDFYYCGCKRNEIKCRDSKGNICCIDCCKIGKFANTIFG